MNQLIQPLASSYRDNAGYIFKADHLFYRCINKIYFPHYENLMQTGLYDELVKAGRLISHDEINIERFAEFNSTEHKIILPQQLPFISYPYEWSFNMWQDAAIVTLKILQVALKNKMVLKDATPFNIQFINGRPVFIDTLSFENYEEGKSWIAYRQFCETFLGPLLLMHYNHRDLGKLLMIYPDGIPLEVTKSLLPLKSKFNVHAYMHIWLQQKVAQKNAGIKEKNVFFSKEKLNNLIKGLLEYVTGLSLKKDKSTWDDYYTNTILGDHYLESKSELVKAFTKDIAFNSVIDLGCNDGYFSMLLKDKATNIVSLDFDSNCINQFYKRCRKENIKNIVPIVSTLNTASPAIGWNNTERESLIDRLKGDLTLALALVHHLAISNNVPLLNIATWLQKMGTYLIIEFIPKEDEKVKELLLHREDIFEQYTLQNFKACFALHYTILKDEKVGNTNRVLFLMQKKIN